MKNLSAFLVLTLSTCIAFAQSTTPNTDTMSAKNSEWMVENPYPQVVNLQEIMQRIHYPEAAKAAKIEGKVIVRILVDGSGKVQSHTVLKSPDDLLTKAVTDQLDALRFTPAVFQGKAASESVTIPFDFRLKD